MAFHQKLDFKLVLNYILGEVVLLETENSDIFKEGKKHLHLF